MMNFDADSCRADPAAYTALLRADYALRARAGAGVDAHPSTATAAASGDLGFSTGPWVTTATDGGRAYGHFLSIWRRDAGCEWFSIHQATVAHGQPNLAEPALLPDSAAPPAGVDPPANLIAVAAVDQAVAEFQQTALEDGFGGALRTFARNNDFDYLTDGELPMNLDVANVYLDHHAAHGDWQESARVKSRDSAILYALGTLADPKHRSARAYVQIWQFDPKVVNWGLRILLLGKAV